MVEVSIGLQPGKRLDYNKKMREEGPRRNLSGITTLMVSGNV